MKFKWADNKVAIIEKENDEGDYDTFQYLIEDQEKLLICKNEKKNNPEDPTWILKRIETDEKHVLVEGKRKVYDDSKSKFPKQS